jgi:hypothetical protein
MIRPILVLVAVGAFLSILAGPGCGGGGVGDPCIPEQEYDVCFAGFDQKEVNVESKSFQCQTRLCLVNHFQGRVSCPYGQNTGPGGANMGKITSGPGCNSTNMECCNQIGGPPFSPLYPGAGTCSVPGGSSVLGDAGAAITAAYQVQVPVLAQVTPRQTANTVYCSCRCADVNGTTENGVYCQCPDGYTCTQLVTSIGGVDEGLTGGYCIKMGTEYNPADTASEQSCSPGINGKGGNPCPLPE